MKGSMPMMIEHLDSDKEYISSVKYVKNLLREDKSF